MKCFDGKRILIIGGTGSLGKTLVRRFLSGRGGEPAKIIVFSRDEAKQHFMRMEYQNKTAATDEIIYRNFQQKLEFRIGDVRDFHSVATVLRDADIVFNTAALKQVPTCEYFPYEAVRTNIEGPENIIRAIHQHNLSVETAVGISTDKACKPINAMGMTQGNTGARLHPSQYSLHGHAICVCALRQRAGFARFRNSTVPGPNSQRRTRDHHDAGYDALPSEPR